MPRAEIDEMPARRSKPDAATLKTATQLLDAMAAHWKPAHYHDNDGEELTSGEERTSRSPAVAPARPSSTRSQPPRRARSST